MKKNGFWFLSVLALTMLFNACSTDVDLYADYKDITIVYGLLDSGKDTNYVKINKAFLGPGNALDIALIADSCNYPFKLDAKIVEYRANAGTNNYQKTRELVLDTMTIHNKETDGFFYAPDQLVYYTKEKIFNNTNQYKYQYELLIDRGDTVLSARTNMVGGYGFDIGNGLMSFSGENAKTITFSPCPNAAIYEVRLSFRFTEVTPNHDSTHRCMEYSLGTFTENELYPTMTDHQYVISHKSNRFFTELAHFLGKDTLNQNVERVVFTDNAFGIWVAAGGEELYNFISVNGPSSSIVQNIPEYTNVVGGYGVFSSRTMLQSWVRFNSIKELKKRENWRFRQG